MARNFDYEKKGLDRCKFYKGVKTNQNKLTRASECEGVFYSKEEEPTTSTTEWINGTQHITKRAKISTRDYVSSLDNDDFVLYNEEYWLVDSYTSADIEDNAKEFTRHANETVINLKI